VTGCTERKILEAYRARYIAAEAREKKLIKAEAQRAIMAAELEAWDSRRVRLWFTNSQHAHTHPYTPKAKSLGKASAQPQQAEVEAEVEDEASVDAELEAEETGPPTQDIPPDWVYDMGLTMEQCEDHYDDFFE
jgi:hypothetical protein